MPQVKDVLLTDKSLRPFFTKFMTSFFLDNGFIKFDFHNDPRVYSAI